MLSVWLCDNNPTWSQWQYVVYCLFWMSVELSHGINEILNLYLYISSSCSLLGQSRSIPVNSADVSWPTNKCHLRCKQKAPFRCLLEDFVMEAGDWGPKQLYGFINGWIPGILVNARCNNDIKFLMNSADTKNVTFYVTTYAANKQGKNFNTSAVLAQGYTYHLEHPNVKYLDSVLDGQWLLLFQIVQSINCEQELAAPMVMSYLMDWGDTFKSHSYSVIYWSSFVGTLLKTFPELQEYHRFVLISSISNDTIITPNSNSSTDFQCIMTIPDSEWVLILL